MPLPGVSVRLLDPEGKPVADGETGEIYLKGSNIFAGYWRREDATRAAFVDGYFRTGDLGGALAGRLLHACRAARAISSSPAASTSIRARSKNFWRSRTASPEAAVAAAPDRVRGEVPVAYIVASAAIDAADLEARCREKLASFKVPRKFVVVEKLPRNALGKIQKHLLPTVTALRLQLYEHKQASFEAYDPRFADVAALLGKPSSNRIPG